MQSWDQTEVVKVLFPRSWQDILTIKLQGVMPVWMEPSYWVSTQMKLLD